MTGAASRYDVIVIGLGGMGSAAACHLAARGHRVLGLERHQRVHDRGSSHGGSRIIRQAYFEDPGYVPLLLRAYELWERLAVDSGHDVYRLTGGLFIGAPDGPTVAGGLRAARRWDLPHEVLDAAEICARFPTFTPDPESLAVPITVERAVMYWLDPVGGVSEFEDHPIFIAENADGTSLYGFPAIDGPRGGVKVAFARKGSPCNPDTIDRTVHGREIDAVRRRAAEVLPALRGDCLRTVTCMYSGRNLGHGHVPARRAHAAARLHCRRGHCLCRTALHLGAGRRPHRTRRPGRQSVAGAAERRAGQGEQATGDLRPCPV
ncbi:FAD-dependent oxidoreductase [Mycobacterium sp. HUMS_1102779]|uniref:FAD-dependent oxidoreductase n=1 Tax=Mycobacterium sp. HUMS_1102779 TaxID=3383487 RepID=UPI00389AFA29